MIYSHYSEYMAQSMSAGRPGPDEGEWEFLAPYLEENEEPFLEMACGYGRLLLPIMEHGYRIVGTDASPEMLEHCRVLAKERNLTPVLHQQFMQRLDIDETFGLILIDDCTFALIVEEMDVRETLERVYRHLKPGGTFLFDYYAAQPGQKESKNHESIGWVKASDGAIYVSRHLLHKNGTLKIHDKYVDGVFVGSQCFEDPWRKFDTRTLIEQLNEHGFEDVRLGRYHSEEPVKENDTMISVRCKRPK
jgi:SAM-dependent methyltransferase